MSWNISALPGKLPWSSALSANVCVSVCLFAPYSYSLWLVIMCVCLLLWLCLWCHQSHVQTYTLAHEGDRDTDRQPWVELCWQAFWHLLLFPFAFFLHPWSAQLILKLYPHLKTGTSRKPACLHCALSIHTNPSTHSVTRTCCLLLQTLREKEQLSRGLSTAVAAAATGWICFYFSTVLKTSPVTSMWWSWMAR